MKTTIAITLAALTLHAPARDYSRPDRLDYTEEKLDTLIDLQKQANETAERARQDALWADPAPTPKPQGYYPPPGAATYRPAKRPQEVRLTDPASIPKVIRPLDAAMVITLGEWLRKVRDCTNLTAAQKKRETDLILKAIRTAASK